MHPGKLLKFFSQITRPWKALGNQYGRATVLEIKLYGF